MRLTKRLIDQFRYEGTKKDEWDVRWDDAILGFGLRIYPSGRKAFILSYRVEGRKRLMQIGDYGVLTLNQARDLAKVHLAGVIQGADPLEKKRRAVKGETVGDLCAAYMERHAKERKRTWRQDERRIDKRILPAWRSLKVTAIRRADVAALHTKIGREGGPYEANRALALISRMFGLASRWGFLPEGAPNPAAGIDKFKEAKRDRWVTPQELPRLAAAINKESNPYVKAALSLYLLTGCRKTELLSATWGDIDFDRCELRLEKTKAGRIHYVPLSDPAIRILRSLPKQKDNPFVFCGRRAGTRIIGIRKTWNRIRKASNLEDVRLHDLRRSVGSWLAGSGASLPLIGRVLNHSNVSTTQIYARLSEDHVRLAMENHGRRLTEAAEPKTDPAERMVAALWKGKANGEEAEKRKDH
ncbi:tyrosine-type recombinase/integrase [Candidatus Manganitrophus noduliformans]|uniref:Tyrosine-type recombinase/integrase n=1 Tax=Candidatus Manganitrophus noduliformans TaxID=2606439 RepID=A0A7X6DNC0_9BACT|nr:site-specific integrase [Candidatus Manganitrophus noduliformans]NKE70305.1 tyrosine-type recombinase/integrase [Candidatus Manganitrophus noduliformans]